MSDSALSCQDHQPYYSSAAAVPFNRFPKGPLDEFYALGFWHAFFPEGVAVAVDVGAAGSADGVGLFVEWTAEGDAVDGAAVEGVVACDYHSCALEVGGGVSWLDM